MWIWDSHGHSDTDALPTHIQAHDLEVQKGADTVGEGFLVD